MSKGICPCGHWTSTQHSADGCWAQVDTAAGRCPCRRQVGDPDESSRVAPWHWTDDVSSVLCPTCRGSCVAQGARGREVCGECDGRGAMAKVKAAPIAPAPAKINAKVRGTSCSEPGCGRPAVAKQLCGRHYQWWMRHERAETT